ncbi:WhiB family transcriptional regulator [Streptacidiphilus albus]|uniref:WhiB family transcriptional regulator n=1 Tax=Streptacidiphilus albus TaxID=105425 RepID=UPI00054B5EB8|nr:WhiB family transcriptional regulator [Streptacidiphilus albus]
MTQDWLARAACRGHDTELWFASPYSTATRAALAICLGCPVVRECLADAMAIEARAPGGRWGTAGARTAEMRQALADGTGHGAQNSLPGCRCAPCRDYRITRDLYHRLLTEAAGPCPGS